MNSFCNKLILIGLSSYFIYITIVPVFAHHHHSPPPLPVEKKIDERRPQQTPEDVNDMPFSVRQHIQAKQGHDDQVAIKPKKSNKPALLLPNHYTRGDKGHLNAMQGWVNSKRQRGNHDIGINSPLPQTADPKQNKTRNVFRRAMPIYEPNY